MIDVIGQIVYQDNLSVPNGKHQKRIDLSD